MSKNYKSDTLPGLNHIVFRGNVTISLKKNFIHLKTGYTRNLAQQIRYSVFLK